MTTTQDEVGALAARLARVAGRNVPLGTTPITGGGNNRVFRLTMDDGEPLILKLYFTSRHDRRDRLGAEWSFLSYAWNRGLRCIPQPLAFDAETSSALYQFISGRKVLPSEIDGRHVDAAAAFVLALNRPLHGNSEALPAASEACFTLQQHIATVDLRIDRLATLDRDAPLRAEAEHFVTTRLRPTWAHIRERISRETKTLGLAPDRELESRECCVSPSDLGFHNALVETTGRVVFIDFEYAGRDDPAKLVCDFFCQLEAPVPLDHYGRFAWRVLEGLGLGEQHEARCRALLDAYRVKWICIILNDFLTVGAARRAFADAGARAQRCAAQLAKASKKLAQISQS